MSDIASNTECDDRNNQLHETIMLSTRQVVESQETMLGRIEALLCKVVESQERNEQIMMEMLKLLSNNNSAGFGNQGAGKSTSFVVPSNQNPSIDIEKIDSPENNDKQPDIHVKLEGEDVELEEEVEVNQEDADQSNFEGYEPMVEAILELDWKKATDYLNNHRTSIKEVFETRDSATEINAILSAATYNFQEMFVMEILQLVPPKALEFVNQEDGGMTILHLAATLGYINIVKALVEKNSNLTQVRTGNLTVPVVPLFYATLNVSDGQKEVLEYLCAVTRGDDPSPFADEYSDTLVGTLIEAEMYGLALSVCQRFPGLAKESFARSENDIYLLRKVAERPFAFLSGTKLTWWERCIYSLMEVDMDLDTPDYGGIINGGKVKLLENPEETKRDEENPRETSSEEQSSTSNKRTITNYLSGYFMQPLRRVPCIKRLYNQKLKHKQVVALLKLFLAQLDEALGAVKSEELFQKSNILEMAVKLGNTEFVLECLQIFPFLCLYREGHESGDTLTKLVAIERNEMIYNFICVLKRRVRRGGFSMLDENDNNILHFTAQLPHNRHLNSVSGAAFQMQREIQWFKGVENTMLQKDRFITNKDGDTAHFLFTEKHKGLMKEGEQWMKETSGSCMVVAALIATVAFAAAFTVPGGNISDSNSSKNGFPVFLDRKSFMIFAVADALALFSSITSVLMFLAVYTSRYSEEDFLKSLPQKIIIGLATLFISMATILISFGAAFAIIVGEKFVWAPIIVALFGCAPVLLFGFLQFPLFVEMVSSTYWPIIFGKEDHLGPYLGRPDKLYP